MKTVSALSFSLAIFLAACGRDDPQALLASAKQYIAKRDFAASAIQLKNVLQKAPDHPEARYLLGVACYNLAERTKLSARPDDLLALYQQACSHLGRVVREKHAQLWFRSDGLELAAYAYPPPLGPRPSTISASGNHRPNNLRKRWSSLGIAAYPHPHWGEPMNGRQYAGRLSCATGPPNLPI